MKETQAVFKPLLEKLGAACGKLEQELVSNHNFFLCCIFGEPRGGLRASKPRRNIDTRWTAAGVLISHLTSGHERRSFYSLPMSEEILLICKV